MSADTMLSSGTFFFFTGSSGTNEPTFHNRYYKQYLKMCSYLLSLLFVEPRFAARQVLPEVPEAGNYDHQTGRPGVYCVVCDNNA